MARTLAGAVGQHLLVRQHRLAAGAEIHRRLAPIRQPCIVELQEQPLRPAHVFRVVTLQAAPIVIHRSDPLQRLRKLPDPSIGERTGMLPRSYRSILGRQSEAVEPDGRKHAVALHRSVAHQQVADGVVAHMPHVCPPAGIGIHGEHIVGRARVVVVYLVVALLTPSLLPFPLYGLRIRRVGIGLRIGLCPRLLRLSFLCHRFQYRLNPV